MLADALILDDFTAAERRTMAKLDRRLGPLPDDFTVGDWMALKVLAHFGLADAKSLRLTERGEEMIDAALVE